LTRDQLLALEHWKPRLEAEDTLRLASRGELKLTPKGWYDLTVYATGDAEAAEKAHNDAVFAALAAKEQVGEVHA
jgi:hypothetical protein